MPLDDHNDERDDFRAPLPRDDRLWLHPSELAADRARHAAAAGDSARSRRRNLAASGTVVLGAAAVIGLVFMASTMRESPAPTTVAVRPAGSAGVIAQRGLVRIDTADTSSTTRSATAVVIRSDGYLLTALGAVGATTPLVAALPDGRTLAASVVGSDRLSGLAVVRVPATDLVITSTGDPGRLAVGDVATAVGATGTPMATGKETQVHAIGLAAPADDNASLHGLIAYDESATGLASSATQSAVLVDDQGRVTALCMWPIRDVQPVAASAGAEPIDTTLGYAIPIDQARATAEELIAKGQATHSWLGVRGGDLDPDASGADPKAGARLTQVQSGSPAARAGLQPGDIVTAVDGHPVRSMSDLVAEIQAHEPGSSMAIAFTRAGKPHIQDIVLDVLPS